MNLKLKSDGLLDVEGWLSGVNRIDSPNHDARPLVTAPALVVIHAISLPPGSLAGTP